MYPFKLHTVGSHKYRYVPNSKMFTQLIEEFKTRRTQLVDKYPDFKEYIINQTPFLEDPCSNTQRLWHLWNKVGDIPSCHNCSNPVNWDIVKQQYRKFCSRQCTARPPKVSTKRSYCVVCGERCTLHRHKTCSRQCFKKYNTQQRGIVWSKDDTIQQIKSVGADRPEFRTNGMDINHPTLFANIWRHTNELPKSNQTRKRIRFLLGLDSNAALRIQRESNETWREDSIQKKYKNTLCPRCGINERPINLKSRRLTKHCPECVEKIALEKKQKEIDRLSPRPRQPPTNFRSDDQLNNREWLIEQHHTLKRTKREIAAMFGVDKETITNRFTKFGIESIRHKTLSNEQDQIVDFIKSLGIVNLVENERTICAPKQLDVYLPEYNLAIEYCGLYWHSTAQGRITPQYHRWKMQQCNARGVRLLTIFSDEWLLAPNLVKGKIASILKLDSTKSVGARQCKVISLSAEDKRRFFDAYHIQGNGPSSVNLALEHMGECVAAMGFTVSGSVATLNRFATSKKIPGGFSKLLKAAIGQHPEWTQILSFADLRWSEGDVYKQAGFKLDATLPPDYQYTRGAERIHKFNFRHKHLSRRLGESYDPTRSETENTKQAKWFKIYDCGKQRWILDIK